MARSQNLLTSIARKSFLMYINSFVMVLVGLISWFFVANYMTTSDVGIVQFAIAYGGLFSMLTDLGFRISHIKKVSEGEDVGKCIGTFTFIQIVLIIIFIITIVASIFIWKNVLGRGFESQSHELMIYLMLGYFTAIQMANIGNQTFAAKVQTAKQQFIPLFASVVQLVMTLYVVIFTQDLFLYGLTFVVGALVQLGVASYFLKDFSFKMPSIPMIKKYVMFAIPVAVGSSLNKIPLNVDKVIIQLFWSADHVGIYFGGSRFSNMLLYIPTGFAVILLPTYSRLDSKKKTKQIKEIVYSTERLLAMIMAPMAVILVILAYPLVTILGDIKYADSTYVLQPLAVWAFIRSLSIPYSNLLVGIGKPKLNAIVSTVTVFSIVILDLIFIPTSIFGVRLFGMGPTGAAVATVIATLISTSLFRFFSYRSKGVFLNPSIFRYMAAAFAMGLVVWGITQFAPVTRFFLLVLMGIIGMEIYVVILFLTKSINRKDMALFEKAINPLLMVLYVKDEFQNRTKPED